MIKMIKLIKYFKNKDKILFKVWIDLQEPATHLKENKQYKIKIFTKESNNKWLKHKITNS
jgi:hypothetical protein